MLGMALGAGLIWLVIFILVTLLTRIPPRGRAGAGPLGLAGIPAALVNLVATQGRLDGAAYAATILDLGSRGELVISEPAPGRLECGLPRSGLALGDLADFEELVLGVARRQAVHGPLPFEVLAESAAADAPGLWASFGKSVREAGRQRGLTRPRLSRLVLTGLLLGAFGVALLIFLAEYGRRTAGLAAPIFAGTVVAVIFTSFVGSLTKQDRLTQAGADLAAQARSGLTGGAAWSPGAGTAPAALHMLAVAVAAHAPVPLAGAEPGRQSGVRLGGQRDAGQPGRRPRAAWSSMSGEWRLVPIRSPGIPLLSNPFIPLSLATALTLAVLIIAVAMRGFPGGSPWSVLIIPLLIAIALAAVGLAALSRYRALPATASFTAQVIARWEQDIDGGENPNVHVYRYAVDDGQQTWCGEVSQADFARIRVGELVQVQAEPRSRTLTSVGFSPAAPGGPW
jgi:Predicted membrane protein (DUF2207)